MPPPRRPPPKREKAKPVEYRPWVDGINPHLIEDVENSGPGRAGELRATTRARTEEIRATFGDEAADGYLRARGLKP